jgi:tetratricopeptide (TPR) repeat protein
MTPWGGWEFPMKHLQRAVVVLLLGLAAGLVPVLVSAQTDEPTPVDPASTEPTAKEQKQKAKEERIAEYLRKKEEKRAQREQTALIKQQEQLARELEAQQLAGQAAAAGAAAGTTAAIPPQGLAPLPRDMAFAQDAIRRTTLAEDPTVQLYLELIDRRMASPYQLAAFGNFLAQNGMNRVGLVYYDVALRLEKKDPTLWVNAGTLYRQVGELNKATQAYSRALSINPAHALAHYNLGAIFDIQGKYKQALEEYRIALTLDPTLGDPAYNPQAAHNDRLLAVKMLIYQETVGNTTLPLMEIDGGGVEGQDPLSGLERDE